MIFSMISTSEDHADSGEGKPSLKSSFDLNWLIATSTATVKCSMFEYLSSIVRVSHE